MKHNLKNLFFACFMNQEYNGNDFHNIENQLVGILLPVITFIPVLVLLNKTEEKK